MDKLISYEELDKHNKPDDVWLEVHGKVYDVTKYLNTHPGGPLILTNKAGKIASKAFELASHTAAVQQKMKQFLVGTINSQSVPAQHQKQNDQTSLGQILIILVIAAGAAVLYYINNSKQSL